MNFGYDELFFIGVLNIFNGIGITVLSFSVKILLNVKSSMETISLSSLINLLSLFTSRPILFLTFFKFLFNQRTIRNLSLFREISLLRTHASFLISFSHVLST